MSDFYKALFSLFASYYMFDMAYPKECKNTYLYLEKVLLKLPNSDKISGGALAAISSIETIYTMKNNMFPDLS